MYCFIVCSLLVLTQQFTTCPVQLKLRKPCNKDFVPVCGKNADGIGTSFINSCTACTTPSINGYDDGLCPFEGLLHPPPLPVVPNYVYCPEPRPLYKCSLIEEPACGIRKTGLPKDYPNTCMACSDRDVVAYLPEKCQINTCPAERTECRLDPNPDYPINCVYQKGKAPTSGSGRCCIGSTYTASTTGVCPNIPSPTPCPEIRNKRCSKTISPVCAISANDKKRTQSNDCIACLDPRVVSYTQGACL